MKIIKSFKNKHFCIKKFTKNKKNDNYDNFNDIDLNDKLFFILNIGNYEFKKNRQYLIDEIEYKIENKENVGNIANFIYDFVKKNFGVNINLEKIIEWIKEKYKYKLEKIKNKE